MTEGGQGVNITKLFDVEIKHSKISGIFKYIFKVHICPIKGDHDMGLECLSDGQVLQILFNL